MRRKKTRPLVPSLYIVAGAGVEPTSGDYEPPEIPFLHPASIYELSYFSLISFTCQPILQPDRIQTVALESNSTSQV